MKWYKINDNGIKYMITKTNPTFIFMYTHLLYGVGEYLLLLSKFYFLFAEIIMSNLHFFCVLNVIWIF